MKTKKKMTNKEYNVAAMLLGYEYHPDYHCYVKFVSQGKWNKSTNFYDPDTMQEISSRQYYARRNRYRGG